MEFAHSFWSEPMKQNRFGKIEDRSKENLLFYATSVSWVHKMGHKITLYADAEGARFLSLIPYDNVVIVENTITDSTKFAASIKFIALEKMPLGDVLIDGDLYLWKPEIYKLLEEATEDVIVSAFERAEDIMWDDTVNYPDIFKQIPDDSFYSIANKYIDGWHNTSLIRFNNAELRDKWIAQYKIYVERYKDIDFGNKWPDVILEQRHLTDLCRNEGYTIRAIANRNIKERPNNKLMYEIGFMHLGVTKYFMKETSFKMLQNNDSKTTRKIKYFLNL